MRKTKYLRIRRVLELTQVVALILLRMTRAFNRMKCVTKKPIKQIVALIVDYRTSAEAGRLACQLAAGKYDFSLSVVHVDNGNIHPVELSLDEKNLGVHLLRVSANDGYAGGLDAGMKAFPQADAYWFLNSDLEVEINALEKLVKVLDEVPEVGAVGPKVYRGRSEKLWGARGVVSVALGMTAMTDWDGGVLPKWSYIPGSTLLIRREALESVGGLPAEYRMYYEETDLCVRLQKAGWDLWVEPSAVAYHSVKSFEDSIPARHFAYYFSRNNLYFWQKNFGVPWPLQFPRMLFFVFKEVILPLRRAKKASVLADRLKYALAGVVDSIPFLWGRSFFDKILFPR